MQNNGVFSPHTHLVRVPSKGLLSSIKINFRDDKPNLASLFQRIDGLAATIAVGDGNGSRHSSITSSRNSSIKGDKTLVLKYGAIKDLIGQGGSSVVWLSKLKGKKGKEEIFAVKGFRKESESKEKEYRANLIEEHEILSTLFHRNVIRTFDLLQDSKGGLYEVLEVCECGDLRSLLDERKLIVSEADCYFKQLMSGVAYIHDMGVVHRDLKPDNLVLTKHGVLKIADFGHSERFKATKDSKPKLIKGRYGSLRYMAPELFHENIREYEAAPTDIWSAGIVYVSMRRYDRLWQQANDKEDDAYLTYTAERRLEQGYAPIQRLGSLEVVNCVYALLDPLPSRRLTAAEFLRSEWGASINICDAVQQAV